MTVDFVKLFSKRTVWKISAGDQGSWWKYFREGNYIGLGMPRKWDADLAFIHDIEEIPKRIGSKRRGYYWRFAKKMKIGDIVIVVGAGKIFGVCEVVSDYFHVNYGVPHRRLVQWFPIPEISNKDGKICKAVYNIQTTLVEIKKPQELKECGKRLNDFVLELSDQTVFEVLNTQVRSQEDFDCLEDISENVKPSRNPETINIMVRRYRREPHIISVLKTLYEGQCQFEGCTNMIETETGWYTEAHHLVPLGEGGSDYPANLVNLCPQHHKMLHYAKNREELANPWNFYYLSEHMDLF